MAQSWLRIKIKKLKTLILTCLKSYLSTTKEHYLTFINNNNAKGIHNLPSLWNSIHKYIKNIYEQVLEIAIVLLLYVTVGFFKLLLKVIF